MDLSQVREEHGAAREHLNLAIMAMPPDNVLVKALMSGNLAKEMARFANRQKKALFHIREAGKKMEDATQTIVLCAALAGAGVGQGENQREFFAAC